MEFMGYRRPDGSCGVRNHVGILSAVVCANEVAIRISNQVQGTVFFTHHQGCCQTSVDLDRVNATLTGLGCNPNLHSVLLLSLGCESTDLAAVVEGIRATGKRVELLTIHECGGAAQTIAKGALLAQRMVEEASKAARTPCPAGALVIGMKCGSSDTTSGLIPNPALGIASDLLVAEGGTSVFGEVTEIIGAEHILAKHAATPEVAKKIYELVARMENRAKAVGVDIRGGQPTQGNIKGGLTTIEEKSLGSIAKAGSSPIRAVCEYGARPGVPGLVLMDSPGREPEILTGLAAAGCTVIAFSTGRGAPQGFPFVPVVKITGNRVTATERMPDHIDLDLSAVIDGDLTLEQAGRRILDCILDVASGRMTRAEIYGYTNSMDIYMVGPVI